MIFDRPKDFLEALAAGAFPADGPACAKAVMLVEPVDFSVCEESARDNVYMNLSGEADAERALEQARNLAALIARQGIDVVTFPGDAGTPDAIFPNNVFATTPERFIVGHMLHPGRQKEALRQDIRAYFDREGYETVDLSTVDCVAELTGALIVDSARRVGFCGMSGRVDERGVQAMHDAFGLRAVLRFGMRPEEYHTNVVLMVLASRACVMYPGAFTDPAVPEAISSVYPGRTLLLDETEKNAFAGNCIALTERDLFMSQTGVDALRPSSRDALESWGFTIHSTALDEIEKAGGSLRCMVAEIF